MNTPDHTPHPPDTRPKAQQLLERLWGICELKGWKHDPTVDADQAFCFRPWGERRPTVRAAAAAITERGTADTRMLAFVRLSTQTVVPDHFLTRHMDAALKKCAEFGVALTAAGLVTTPGPPWPVRAVNLTLAVPDRALTLGGVDDLLLIFVTLCWQLARLWQALDATDGEQRWKRE